MGFFLPQMPFSPLMKNTAHSAFLELSPSVEGDRDVVCDPPLYSRLTMQSLTSPLVVEKNPKGHRRRALVL